MMTPRAWPNYLDDIWAKSAAKGEGGEPETLATHTWNVLEKLAATIHLRPNLPTQIGIPRLWHCLFWATFLHDFGKAAKGFQARLRDGPKWDHRHEVLSLAFIDWIAEIFSEEEQRWVAAAIASHHRDEGEISLRYNQLDPTEQNLRGLINELEQETVAKLRQWLVDCPENWLDLLGLQAVGIELPALPAQTNAVQMVLAHGVTGIRKWLRSYHRWLDRTVNQSEEPSLIIGTMVLRGHLVTADHIASAHVGELPPPQLSDIDRLLACLNLKELYVHQRESMTIQGSAVLMSPTGSGKTEAALLWTVAQAEQGRSVPRLYYVLPFQASMNAMWRRLNDDEGERKAPFPKQVGLEHGRSTLAFYRRLLEDDYSPRQAAKEAKWRKNLAELHYYPVRVLSPYQLLKAPYRLKGYETLLTDCFSATFIFDEIHAYEASRLAKILATVKYLRENYNGRFFVMSATLPKLLRERLSDALGNYALLQASDDLYRQFRRHTLILKDGELLDASNLDRIADVARSGQAVLVCCNTVDRAQKAREQLFERLRAEIENEKVTLELLHGRFNGKDRLDKENKVRTATGSRSTQRKPIVLVATQVVEVSLDIDLDVIYTDPAPLEALLQRFGRINRRRLRECAPVCVFRQPNDGQGIYTEELVQLGLHVLEKHEGCLIDEAQVSKWLEEVYADEAIASEWNQQYDAAYTDFCRDVLAQLRAFQSDPALEDLFYQAFDNIEVLPKIFWDEYEELIEKGEPLEAGQLFVPISYGRYHQLRNSRRLLTDKWPFVVDVPYTKEAGLDFNNLKKVEAGDDY